MNETKKNEEVKVKDLTEELAEIKTKKVALSEGGDEVYVKVEECILEEDEETRIVISVKKDGSIIIHTKTDKENDLTVTNVVGFLEVAKFDIMNAQANPSQAAPAQGYNPEDAQPTEIELTEEDFKNIPELEGMGHKVGSVITLPKIAADKLISERG